MVIAGIVLSITVVVLIVARCTYRTCFYSPKNRVDDPYAPLDSDQYNQVAHLIRRCTAVTEKRPFRWVHTTAFDNIMLFGRYYHKKDGAPLIILFHGYRGSALRDCTGGLILADRLGFNVLTVDQRGHGRSGGTAITFGILERYDCLRWAEYSAHHLTQGAPILLSGLSMGAATVLMAAELPLPKDVVGIMADCPYSSPKDIIKKVCKDRKLPPNLAYPFVWLGAKLFGHFDLNASSPVKAIALTKVPILLFHGEEDHFVPCQMSRAIQSANTKFCSLHTFPVTDHGLSYMIDPLHYERATFDFLNNIPEVAVWLEKYSIRDFLFDNFREK